MKKLITLLLVLTGMVSTANATDYVVAGVSAIANGHEWDNNAADNLMSRADDDHYYLVVHNCTLYRPTNEYANKYAWQVTEKGTWDGFKTSTYDLQISEDGTYSLIFIVKISTKELNVVPVKNLTLSNNYGSNNTWNGDNSSFYFTYSNGTKWTIDINSSDVTKSWRFRVWTSGILYWNGWHNIAATSEGEQLALGTSSNASYSANDTNNSWEVEYPSYSFNKYTISAEYDVINQNWVVSADAYISKTVVASNKYATLGCSAALDLSGLPATVTAYPLTANATTGKITKGTAITTVLGAGKGVLLESSDAENDVVLSIPISAEAGAAGDNDLVATTGTSVAKVTEDGYTNYILASQNNHVGFYMVNTAGNGMGANTAYLHVADAEGARSFFALDDSESVTAINAVDQNANANGDFFNIAGQRVAQPTKGLYIVNGKKVIIK